MDDFFDEGYDIPSYGDDGALRSSSPVSQNPAPLPSPPPAEPPSLTDCDRCRGKFVYRRRPVCKKCIVKDVQKAKQADIKPKLRLRVKPRK